MHNEVASVIVAAYNEESTIEKCIMSLINQTYKYIEIIVIDDGSEDQTWEILKKLKQKYDIHIYRQQNQGVSVARNVGIEKATGKWIAFCDADDYYLPYAIESLVLSAIKHKVNIVQGGLDRKGKLEEEGVTCEIPSYVAEKILLNTETSLNRNIYEWLDTHARQSIHGPYGKVFDRDFLIKNEIYFPIDITLGEDLIFYLKALLNTKKVVIDTRDTYVVYNNPNSVTRRYNPELPDASDKFVEKITNLLKGKEELMDDLAYTIYNHYCTAVNQYFLHPSKNTSIFLTAKELKRFGNNDYYQRSFNYIYKNSKRIVTRIDTWLLAHKKTLLFIFLRYIKKEMRGIRSIT